MEGVRHPTFHTQKYLPTYSSACSEPTINHLTALQRKELHVTHRNRAVSCLFGRHGLSIDAEVYAEACRCLLLAAVHQDDITILCWRSRATDSPEHPLLLSASGYVLQYPSISRTYQGISLISRTDAQADFPFQDTNPRGICRGPWWWC
jgi:hypothetical protein